MTLSLDEHCRKVLLFHEQLFDGLNPKNEYEKAAALMVRRGSSLLTSISLLMEKKQVVEAAILLRTLMNLFWGYLFLIGARLDQGYWAFEEAPNPDRAEFRRAVRFLHWPVVDAYKKREQTEKVIKAFSELKRKYGYHKDNEVPDCWYAEPKIGVLDKNIRSIAAFAGAEEQYLDDLVRLSSIDQSDMTAVLAGNRIRAGQAAIGNFVYFKAIQFFAQMVDMVVPIIGKKHAEAERSLFGELNEIGGSIFSEMDLLERANEK